MDLIVDFFLVGGIVIIAVILLHLLKLKEKELPQKILIVLFFLLFSVSIYFYGLLHNIKELAAFFFLPNDITIIILGPLLFLYVKSLFLKEENLVKNNIVHFIPTFLFALCITIPTIIFNTFKVTSLAYTHSNSIRVIIKTDGLYFIGYLIVSLQLLIKYRKLTKYKYSNLTKFDFNWIKIMLISALSIMVFDLFVKIYKTFFVDFNVDTDYITVLAMIVLVIYLGYHGVNQSKVLLPSFLLKNEIKPEIINTKKQETSPVKKEEFKTLKNELELLLNTHQPYLDEDLTLGKLAKQIATTDKKLSILLNQYMNITFYDLINKYRVKAVKEKINTEAYKNYNLFGIACECGFKSRTSFNRIFKKETGLSPSEYKKSIS